jgi:hypothetical protein
LVFWVLLFLTHTHGRLSLALFAKSGIREWWIVRHRNIGDDEIMGVAQDLLIYWYGIPTLVLEYKQKLVMAKSTITIPLDPETAQAYNSAAPEEKRKMQALVSLWLRELAVDECPPLQQILDEVGTKARARGLTAEVLDSLLKGA